MLAKTGSRRDSNRESVASFSAFGGCVRNPGSITGYNYYPISCQIVTNSFRLLFSVFGITGCCSRNSNLDFLYIALLLLIYGKRGQKAIVQTFGLR